MRRIFFIIILFILIKINFGFSQCEIKDTLIKIPDNEKPLGIKLIVEGVLNNDLADIDQGVCGVHLNFEHYQRTELTIDLISPSGQKVKLVGPYNPFSSPNPGNRKWDIDFVQCSKAANPDPGKSEHFDNNDNWGFLTQYNGTYYPHDWCLEEFDSGPVNGTWTFLVYDHETIYTGKILGYSIEFCDESVYDCNPCSPNSGYFNTDTLKYCINDPDKRGDISLLYEGSKADSTEYKYNFIISKNGSFSSVSDSFDIDTFGIGEYKIWGLSYHRNDSSKIFKLLQNYTFNKFIDTLKLESSTFCAQLMKVPLVVVIEDNDVVEFNSITLCEGEIYSFHGTEISEPGDYFFKSTLNICDTTFFLSVTTIELNAGILVSDSVINCEDNGSVKLIGSGYYDGVGMSFEWLEFPGNNNIEILVGQAGTYHFILKAGKCSDTARVVITADNDIPEIDSIKIQQIDCCHDFGEIAIFISNVNITDYKWELDGIQISNNSSQLSTNKPGKYIVTVLSDVGCKAEISVFLPIDTLKPVLSFDYNDITCINPNSIINLNSNADLVLINWVETGETTNSITVNDGDIYHVAVVGTNCCQTLDSVEVEEFTKKPEIIVSGGSLDCKFNTADLEFSSPDSIIYFKWTTPDNIELFSKKITVSKQGKYFIEVTNDYGCMNLDSIILTADIEAPDIFIPDIPVLLTCGTDSIQLTFTTSSSVLEVEWNGPGIEASNQLYPFVKFEGTYYIKLTSTNHCYTIDSIVVLHDNTVPEIQIQTDTINCIDKEINIGINYTGNYSFEWLDPNNNLLSGSIVNSTLSGFYQLTVTDLDNNCSSQFLIEAPVDTTPVQFIVNASGILDCNHKFVNLYLSNYDRINTIEWSNSSFNSFSDTAKVIYPGTYYVDVISENECVLSDSIVVLSGEYLNIYPDTFLLTCSNPEQIVELPGINPNYTFTWKGPNGIFSDSPNPVFNQAGAYRVNVTNGNCTDSTVITIYEDKNIPEIEIEADTIIPCEPDYAVLKGKILSDKIAIYSWNGPGVYSPNNLTYFAKKAGRYTFIVAGENGCTDSLFVNVKLSQDYPQIKVRGDTMNCFTGPHPLTISCEVIGSFTTVEWTGPLGQDSIKYYSLTNIVPFSGTYVCRVSNELGCISADTISVIIDTLKPPLFFDPVETITCFYEQVDVSVHTDPDVNSFSWSGPYGFYSDNKDIQVGFGGKYFLEIIGPNGCSQNDSVEVKVNKLKPYIFLSGQTINGNNGKVKLEMHTTAINYTLIWEWPDGTNTYSDSLRTILEGLYKITVTDIDNGCFSVDSILILKDTVPPDIIAVDYYLPCDGTLIKMHVYSNKPGTIFYWYGPGSFYVEGATAFTNIAGKYYIYAEGINGNISLDSIEVFDISVLPEFEAFGNQLTCTKHLVPIKAVGVVDDKSYYWKGPGNFFSDLREPLVSLPGFYTLIVTGKNGCTDSIVVEVAIDTIKPVFNISYTDSLVCENNNAKLHIENTSSAGRTYTYSWQTNNGKLDYGIYSANPVIIGAGTYIVKVTDVKNGCFIFDSITIESEAYELDSISFSISEPTCFGYSDGSVSIDSVYGGIGPYTYSTDNYYFSNINIFNSKKAGTYKFYAKDKNGCKTDTLILIKDGGDVQVSLGADREEIYAGNRVRIEAIINALNGISEINWDPYELFNVSDSFKVDIFPLSSTLISLEVVDSNGCKGNDDLWIRVLSKPDVYVPNIFTPDGDGFNDYFFIKTKNGVKSIIDFKIFDRWGELIYQNNKMRLNVPIDGWDGKFNGNVVQNGVYVCYYALLLENGKTETFYTDLTLIK